MVLGFPKLNCRIKINFFIYLFILLLYLLHLQCDTYITYIVYSNHDIQYTKYSIYIALHYGA